MILPQDHITRVLAKQELGPHAFILELHAPDLARQLLPGQFLQVRLNAVGSDPLLRRPLGYLSRDEAGGRIRLLVGVVGRGTAILGGVRPGDELSVLGPLGRGFDLTPSGPVLLVAGGIGVVPLCDLAERLSPRVPVTLVYGARSAPELFALEILRALPLRFILATDDGSVGMPGTAVTALSGLALEEFVFYYGCGPRPMSAALQSIMGARAVPGELSLEERMACGFGACLGCAVAVREQSGGLTYRRVCAEGPVFSAEEVVFGA